MKKDLLIISIAYCLLLLSFSAQSQCVIPFAMPKYSATDEVCPYSGSITIHVTGSGTYSYSKWIDSTGVYDIPTTNPTFSFLKTGNYTFKVKNLLSGCEDTLICNVPGGYPSLSVYTPTASPSFLCHNGSIQGTVTGGRGMITYSIIDSAGLGIVYDTSGTFTNLSPGTYTLRATDTCPLYVTSNALTVPDSIWNIIHTVATKTGCNAYSLNSVIFSDSVGAAIDSFYVEHGGVVLNSGVSLPLTFNVSDSFIDSVKVCAKDSQGCKRCKSLSAPMDWMIDTAVISHISCYTFQVNNVVTTDTPVHPLSYAFIRAVDTTAWYSSLPFTFYENPDSANYTGYVIVKDACGIIRQDPHGIYMGIKGQALMDFSTCTTSQLNASYVGQFMSPVTYSLTGGSTNNTGIFTNLNDGTYTVTMSDACGWIRTVVDSISHVWKAVDFTPKPFCDTDLYYHRIFIKQRMKPPVLIKQYRPYVTNYTVDTLSTQTTDSNFTWVWRNSDSLKGSLTFITRADSSYKYIIIDSCDRTDTLIKTNDPYTHVANTVEGTVIPGCNNKGRIGIDFFSDNPPIYPVRLSLFKYRPWASNLTIFINHQPDSNHGVYTYPLDLDTGTYLIKMQPKNCNEVTYDTVQIKPYQSPQFQNVLAFFCPGNTVNVLAWGKLGVPPYRYRLQAPIITPWSTSNIFTIPTWLSPYTHIKVILEDYCGTSSEYLTGPQNPYPLNMYTSNNFPDCNANSLHLYVDSLLTGATYQWTNPQGVNLGTGPSIHVAPLTPADTGTYSCRVIFPGTCYDQVSTFRLRLSDIQCYSQLGNRVWNDTDRDGIMDTNEVGMAGITVTLYDSNQRIVEACITDAKGYYRFSRPDPGMYQIRFTLPANYVFSPQNMGANNLFDSDADPHSGLTSWINITGPNPIIDTSIDAGIHLSQHAGIRNYVWNDINVNGLQDNNEIGICGITTTLYNSSGQPILSTISNSQGYSYFDDLQAGVYKIGVTLPIGYRFTNANMGSNDATDSDVLPSTSSTHTINLSSEEVNETLDIGLFAQQNNRASVGSQVWYDANQNLQQDDAEAGVAGILVTLTNSGGGSPAASTVTDALGNYVFNNLIPGTYSVSLSNLPSGYVFTTPASLPLTLVAGRKEVDANAGIYKSSSNNASIGNRVWYDHNANGIQENGENGVPGVSVNLYNSLGNKVDSTVTDLRGMYHFNHISLGVYTIGFSNLPQGYWFSPALQGADPNADSNPDIIYGKTGSINITAAGSILHVDAGLVKAVGNNATVSIGDRVWVDLNQNHLYEISEPGMPGVNVKLYDSVTNSLIDSTITDALGHYLFTGLPAGTYRVGYFNLPSGYNFVNANQGSNDDIDADADASTGGLSGNYRLAKGQDNLTIDAGVRSSVIKASLGNLVWNDSNKNGLRDIGEPGVQGVTVRLLTHTDSLLSATTTDAHGAYMFNGLDAGTYRLEFINLPAGYQFTVRDVGLDSLDSDADPITGVTNSYSLNSMQHRSDIDAGLITVKAMLSNKVWNDLNKDGVQQSNEKGLPGISIALHKTIGNAWVSAAVTNAEGSYCFSNLDTSSYKIHISGLSGSAEFSPELQGSDTTKDSDIIPVNGSTSGFNLNAGQCMQSKDAGIMISLSSGLGDYFWQDTSGDGAQSSGEKGAPGITSTMEDNNGNTKACTISDRLGYYSFPSITAGTYRIILSTLPLYRNFTTSNALTGNDSMDSDIDVSTIIPGTTSILSAKSFPLQLNAGVFNATIDAGLISSLALDLQSLIAEASLSLNTSTIRWTTMNEKGINDFSIQRSLDAKNFTTLQQIKANGNTNGMSEYQTQDDISSLMDQERIYYRVIAQDYDGTMSYSNIVSVQPGGEVGDVLFYPLPFNDHLLLDYIAASNTKLQISLSDMSQRIVYAKDVSVFSGNNHIKLEHLGHLSKGVYLIQIRNVQGQIRYTGKLIKE